MNKDSYSGRRARSALAVPALALAATVTAVSVHAQQRQADEEIVVIGTLTPYGATKSNAPIIETARSVVVETSDQFVEKGALNLSQTATYLAGVSAETYGFATRGDWIHSRGFDLPRYRDSIQELFGSYNSTRADIYTIQQVEVLKGPASVLYGQGSPGGIINYVSKSPAEEQASEFVAEVGNYDRVEFAADFNSGFGMAGGRLGYRIVGLYRESESQVDYVHEDTRLLMPSISYAFTDRTRITAIGLVQDTDSDVGAQFIPVEGTLTPLMGDGGTFIDQDVYAGEPEFNQYLTESTQLTLLAEHEFSASWLLEGTAIYRDGESDYHQAWPTFVGAGVSRYLNNVAGMPVATDTTVPRSFYQAEGSFDQIAADFRLRATLGSGAVSHELLMGVQYQDVETDTDAAYFYGGGAFDDDYSFALDLANPIYGSVPDQSVFDQLLSDTPAQEVRQTSFYVSDQISFGNWRLTAGLRHDDVDNDDGTIRQSDSAVSASVGMLYRFENGFSPYASYAESFETVVGTTLAGDQLEPEEARQYEIGFKYEPRSIRALLTLSAFDTEVSNLPNPNSLPGDAAQQQGVSTIGGIEFDARANIGAFYLQGALAVLDAEDPNGFELSAEPESLASMWVTWRPAESVPGLKVGAGVRYVGQSVSENETVRYVTPSYTVGDLMVGYEFSEDWGLAVNIRNVTDKKYLTACLTRGDCFPGLRRTVNASLTRAF